MRGSLRIKSIKGCTEHYGVSNALSLIGTYGGWSIKDYGLRMGASLYPLSTTEIKGLP